MVPNNKTLLGGAHSDTVSEPSHPKRRPGKAAAAARMTQANDIPVTMLAAAIDHFGPPEELKIHEMPVPILDEREVLIRVHTAGVGGWDAEMRSGAWAPENPSFPLVLGTDGAGIVAAMGSHVRRFEVGNSVYSYSFNNPKGGFYAEYVAVEAEKAAPIPSNLDLEHAGAIPTTGLTALQGIDNALRLRAGESIIIHGASGGVGTMAVQFAKLRGARVLATASGRDGVALVLKLGADVGVDGRHDNILEAARLFAPKGVDAILAMAGGEALESCLDALRDRGRVAYPNGIEPEPRRRPGIRITSYDAVAGAREFKHLNEAVEGCDLQVPIADAYPLVDARKAHERIEEGHVLGKIVLRIS